MLTNFPLLELKMVRALKYHHLMIKYIYNLKLNENYLRPQFSLKPSYLN